MNTKLKVGDIFLYNGLEPKYTVLSLSKTKVVTEWGEDFLVYVTPGISRLNGRKFFIINDTFDSGVTIIGHKKKEVDETGMDFL